MEERKAYDPTEGYDSERRGPASRVREYARAAYIEPAVRRGDEAVTILAGDVVANLRMTNRTPAVCAALRSKAFLTENHLTIEKDEGPPSGMSTTVKITYRLPRAKSPASTLGRLDAMRGVLRDTYAQLGGGEAHLRAEREDWGD